MANIILPSADIVDDMSVTTAITDGNSIFISYDSLLRIRSQDGTEKIEVNPAHRKVKKINNRTAVGAVGAIDPSRDDFLAAFAKYNEPFIEFDQIFNNLMMEVMNWTYRRPEEQICISLMGFNGTTPVFRSIAIEGMARPWAQSDYTISMVTGDQVVQDRIVELLNGHAFQDIQKELHDLVAKAIEENPDVVGPPIHDMILHP